MDISILSLVLSALISVIISYTVAYLKVKSEEKKKLMEVYNEFLREDLRSFSDIIKDLGVDFVRVLDMMELVPRGENLVKLTVKSDPIPKSFHELDHYMLINYFEAMVNFHNQLISKYNVLSESKKENMFSNIFQWLRIFISMNGLLAMYIINKRNFIVQTIFEMPYQMYIPTTYKRKPADILSGSLELIKTSELMTDNSVRSKVLDVKIEKILKKIDKDPFKVTDPKIYEKVQNIISITWFLLYRLANKTYKDMISIIDNIQTTPK